MWGCGLWDGEVALKPMTEIDELLLRWQSSLCSNISYAGLLAENPIANKWKANSRSLLLRECVHWRTFDLLKQAHTLFTQDHVLGSRILLRSALESVAILIYLNQMTKDVLDGALNFHTFSENTSRLLLGSRNKTTKHEPFRIGRVLKESNRKYEGICDVYEDLCESAHPNFEGVCFGYARVDFDRHESNFSNNWADMWSDRHLPLIKLIATVFEHEYNEVWPQQFNNLEVWLVKHDAELEATKDEQA